MATQIVMVHTFKAYRLRSPGKGPAGAPEDPNRVTAEDLADLLTELSHQGKLGPIVNVIGDRAIIVGELTGMVGMNIEATIESAAGARLPPPPGAKAAGNRR